MPNLAPLPRPSRCSSPDPALTRPTWLNSYPPPATVNPCRARPENWTQPAAFIQPRGRTPGQQEAAPAAFWFAAGASVWTEGQTPALPLPAPACVPTAIARPTAERSALPSEPRRAQWPDQPPLCWAEKRKGVGADRAAVPPPSPGFRARGRTPLPRWRLRPYRRPPDRPPALWTPSCFASEPRAAPPPRCGLRLRCPSPAASDQKPASGRPPDNRTAPVLPPDKRKRLDGHRPIRPTSDCPPSTRPDALPPAA